MNQISFRSAPAAPGTERSAQQDLSLGAAEQSALRTFAETLVGLSRFDEAAEAFRLLLQQDPHSGYLHRAYGICCENLDRLDEARRALDRAIEIDPCDVLARVTRASLCLRAGDRAGARDDVDRLQTCPTFEAARPGASAGAPALAGRIRMLQKILTAAPPGGTQAR